MMIAKALCYRNVSDVDMVLNLDDFPLFRYNESTQCFPIMSWSKSEAFNDIHFPYWSFTGRRCSHVVPVERSDTA
jgi:hypothetical protein